MENIFGKEHFYLEMQPSHGKEQIFVNKQLLKISQENQLRQPSDAFPIL